MTTDPAHGEVDPAIASALHAAREFVMSLGADNDGEEVRPSAATKHGGCAR